MTLEEINETIELADRGVVYPLTEPQRANLRGGVVKMARALREQPSDTALDDAARYLRALWPHGSSLTFSVGDENGGPRVRWSAVNWTGQIVDVARVENEAPSATLARIVEKLRAMVEEECNVATVRAARLRAAIGGES